ncbi:Na(+)/H(+) exchange regulatory cofactor NHE-RF2 [Pholidichthys leucotaenia]
MESELRPRMCFLMKGDHGYGFHLHGERSRGGQFIRKVEPGSPADLGGLRPGDRVVEVNGENVEKEAHHQVVNRIQEVPHRTRLLVVDRVTDEFLYSHGLACTEDLAIEMGTLSPRTSRGPTPSVSPRQNSPMPPSLTHVFNFQAVESPTRMVTQGKVSRSSVTSSTTTDAELQIEPSPEPRVELLPRLCHLVKGEQGYGFNLHSDKKKRGQFVRAVDPGSPAESAGVRAGDRILEVNDVTTQGLRHSEVVALIRKGEEEVRLLVVDAETDKLFSRLGITPAISHIKEVYVDDIDAESEQPTPSPTVELPSRDTPIINVTMDNSPITKLSPKARAHGSSASQSSRSSTTQSEISSSDMSIPVPDEDDRLVSDPYMETGLHLSPTAAEAKQKLLARRNKKQAPPMDWSRKQEIFSNF